jgi:hypothetical protein
MRPDALRLSVTGFTRSVLSLSESNAGTDSTTVRPGPPPDEPTWT